MMAAAMRAASRRDATDAGGLQPEHDARAHGHGHRHRQSVGQQVGSVLASYQDFGPQRTAHINSGTRGGYQQASACSELGARAALHLRQNQWATPL